MIGGVAWVTRLFSVPTQAKKCNYVKCHVTVLLSEVNSRHSFVTTLKKLKKKSNFIKDRKVCLLCQLMRTQWDTLSVIYVDQSEWMMADVSVVVQGFETANKRQIKVDICHIMIEKNDCWLKKNYRNQ